MQAINFPRFSLYKPQRNTDHAFPAFGLTWSTFAKNHFCYLRLYCSLATGLIHPSVLSAAYLYQRRR